MIVGLLWRRSSAALFFQYPSWKPDRSKFPDTILTAFPKRWGRNKPDSSGIHKSLRERLDRVGGEVTSVWHLGGSNT